MNVVLDTNTLVSGLVTGYSAPPQIMAQWSRQAFNLYVSEHILDGAARALRKPYWQRRLDIVDLEARLSRLRSTVNTVIPVSNIHGVAEDDEDDLVIATAVAARADYLVTGDKYMQSIGEFRGVRIVSPRQFLDMLLSLP